MSWWKNPRTWAIVGPALIISIWMAWALSPLSGEEILLETGGYDPPDLFRGDYVDLRYEIANIPSDAPWAQELFYRQPPIGATVYYYLSEGSETDLGGRNYWVPRHVSLYEADYLDDAETVCLKGKVVSASEAFVQTELGMESFFVQKNADMRDWAGKEISIVAKVKGCEARADHARLDGVKWSP